MPRVPRRKDAGTANSPLRSPKSIPLNDDQNEKAARFQSRQALHEQHLSQIRAAASPGHRKAQHDHAAKDTSTTIPGNESKEAEAANVWTGLGVSAIANMKRVPILANFEEWMKMATDNKINATNSWNFALIDYFHDMSLLKEGDSVNFQKASCTLDGCVKIYTSRVDSVATETGKLLSGLADSGGRDHESQQENDDGGDGDGDAEERKKGRKKATRSSEATLASSFTQLQLRKFELEFAVDPLFKKASADFDEGGAKGLLLNHLCIDGSGRIIFDSSDDTDDFRINDQSAADQKPDDTITASGTFGPSQLAEEADNTDIDVADLQLRFMPDLASLDNQEICPSLKGLEFGGTLDLASLSILQDHRNKNDSLAVTNNITDAGFLTLGMEGEESNGQELDFGSGGEVWAQEAGLEPMFINTSNGFDRDGSGGEDHDEEDSDDEGAVFGVKMHFDAKNVGQSDILGYFDSTLKANWAGPEHWRIKRMKRDNIPREGPKRREKEQFEIDFHTSLPQKVTEQIHISASSNSSISLPKSQWRSRTRHLLPDDKHFSSNHLLRLFLKPKARLGRRGASRHMSKNLTEQLDPMHVEDAYWAGKFSADDSTSQAGFDVDFFGEEETGFPLGILDDDADDFADAREAFSPTFGQEDQATAFSATTSEVTDGLETGYGSALVTKSRRLRPDYVSYAKIAKKVDLRLLKEKMWRGIGFDTPLTGDGRLPVVQQLREPSADQASGLNFTAVMNSLQHTYSPEAMADISTSYCFISLLHLANEKGLVLSNESGLEDLVIRPDVSSDVHVSA